MTPPFTKKAESHPLWLSAYDFCLFFLCYGLHQQHHGAAQFVPHPGRVQHLLGGLGFLHRVDGKAAGAQSHQDLGEGVMLLFHLAAQKVGQRSPGVK